MKIGLIIILGVCLFVYFSIKSKTPNPEIVSKIIQYAVHHGLMLENSGIYGNVIRFLAPLVMTDEQLDAGLKIFEEAIKNCM